MDSYLRLTLYLAIALVFAWLVWRNIFASVPEARRNVHSKRASHPLLRGLHMLFYGGMASFEMSHNLGF